MSTTKLYKKDAKGKMRFWEINTIDDESITRFGTVGGVIQEHIEYVDGNTLRNAEEQALLEAEAKIKKRIETGYRHTIDEAMGYDNSNVLGYHKPMLAQPFKKIKNINFEDSTYQHKFDGHRCLITNDAGEKIAYSRNGKRIFTIGHILDDIDIPEGVTLDGELYIHNMKLQSITSCVKRIQNRNKLLKFHCYDAVLKENFEERLKFIKELKLGNNAYVVDTLMYTNLYTMLEESLNSGYEGLIIRPNKGYVYEGKRSKGLIKVKSTIDSEFMIVNITPSKEGYAILHCLANNGSIFTATSPGTVLNKRNALINKDMIIGRYVKIKYATLTESGIPFHPIATGYIEDVNFEP